MGPRACLRARVHANYNLFIDVSMYRCASWTLRVWTSLWTPRAMSSVRYTRMNVWCFDSSVVRCVCRGCVSCCCGHGKASTLCLTSRSMHVSCLKIHFTVYWCVQVNSSPGFEGLERASHVNVAAAFIAQASTTISEHKAEMRQRRRKRTLQEVAIQEDHMPEGPAVKKQKGARRSSMRRP